MFKKIIITSISVYKHVTWFKHNTKSASFTLFNILYTPLKTPGQYSYSDEKINYSTNVFFIEKENCAFCVFLQEQLYSPEDY